MPRRSELREARLRRLLRRADWRFLLPQQAPETTLCLADGELREGVELISNRVVDRVMADTRDVDLAVAVDPSRGTLVKLFDALRPGGSCYTEWYSYGGPGARGVRRLLEAAGFRHVRCYAPWRAPPRCQLWLPLDAPGALAYFWRRPLPYRQLVPRVRSRLARLAVAAGIRLDLVRPVCAVAHRMPLTSEPSTGPEAAFGPPLPWTAGAGARGDLAWALLTTGQRSICKVVGLGFAERNPVPQLVVKMARVPESIPGLAREAAALRMLGERGPRGVPGVPRLLFHMHDAATATIGETFLQGVPLTGVVSRRTYRDIALKATAWSADLAACARPGSSVPIWTRRIKPAFEEFVEWFGPILDPGMVLAARERLASVPDLPVVCEQRDFSPWNVFLTPEHELAVLDWESAEPDGLPALDLVYFLTHLGFAADGLRVPPHDTAEANRLIACYGEGLYPSTFRGRVNRACLAEYCHRTGVAPAVLSRLRLFVWVVHARSEYLHFLADDAGRPGPATLRRSLFVRLWEEEMRCTATR